MGGGELRRRGGVVELARWSFNRTFNSKTEGLVVRSYVYLFIAVLFPSLDEKRLHIVSLHPGINGYRRYTAGVNHAMD